MKKRGRKAQAGMIVTILIILIILAAIAILWNVVNFFLKESSGEVSIGQFAFKGELSYGIIDDSNPNPNPDTLHVEVKRGSGGGEIKGVKIIIETGSGTYSYTETDSAKLPGELETKTYDITVDDLIPVGLLDFSDVKKVSVHFIYGDNKITHEIDSEDSPTDQSCESDAECDDSNLCTDDSCFNELCINTNSVTCPAGESCNPLTGNCECVPDCSGKECGEDGCGGTCSPGCSAEEGCINGACEIISDCFDLVQDPVPICTCDDLQRINEDLSANYELQNDVDCSDTINWNSGAGFNSIASSFTGILNGNYHTISDLYINRPSESGSMGLFRYVYQGEISNLKLIDVSLTGNSQVGGIAGIFQSSDMVNCSSHGNIIGNSYVGGLTGYSGAYSHIDSSYSSGDVTGENSVGGIAGYHYYSIINNTYSTANIKSEVDSAMGIGGLVGLSWVSGEIQNSYFAGNIRITGNNANHVGGLTGRLGYRIRDSYSVANIKFFEDGISIRQYIGILTGTYGIISNTYIYDWPDDDAEFALGYGYDGEALRADSNTDFFDSNYVFYQDSGTWDFTNIWQENADNYPTLQWQSF